MLALLHIAHYSKATSFAVIQHTPDATNGHGVLDHTTSETESGSKLGIDATMKLAGEGFKRTWPPLIRIWVKPRERK